MYKYSGIPHRVSDVSMFGYAQQLVWSGDGVQVGAESVVEVSVRLPDLLQHLDVQAQMGDGGASVAAAPQTGER